MAYSLNNSCFINNDSINQLGSSSFKEKNKKDEILLIAYECAKIGIKYGGLGEAVYGMACGFKEKEHRVTVLIPYFDVLPEATKKVLISDGKIASHSVDGKTKEDKLYEAEIDGITFVALEDTPGDKATPYINHYQIENPSKMYEDGILANKEEKWHGLKERMMYFSSAVAGYLAQHSKHDVVFFHDWHAAYSIELLKLRKESDWFSGKIPATILVIHNNSYGCQGIYGETKKSPSSHIPQKFGGHKGGVNVMLTTMHRFDHVVTVSRKFAEEMQSPAFGAGIDPWVRELAKQGNFTGIINGSNPKLWNPELHPQLKNWRDPNTGEAIDLSFKSTDHDLIEKKQLIRIQIMKWLHRYYPNVIKKNRLNLTEGEIVLSIGRYDSTQKGLDKFLPIMKTVVKKGNSFIALGVGEDSVATEILDELEKESLLLGGCWITRGKQDNESLKIQNGTPEVPGIGVLLRAAATLVVIPSSFEPCGYVQYEGWGFGSLILGTNTGGLADTVVANPMDKNFNGFLFEKKEAWYSKEQDQEIEKTVDRALEYLFSLTPETKVKLMRNAMEYAKLSSWTSSPQGSSPISQYGIAIEKAKKMIQERLKKIDLPKEGVTYELLPLSRLGDNLNCYINAKWVAYKTNLPLIFKSFPNAEKLTLSQNQKYTYRINEWVHFKTFSYEKFVKNKDNINYWQVPFFANFDAKINWEDKKFRRSITEDLDLINSNTFSLPVPGRVNIALHLRTGGSFDAPSATYLYPTKIPPRAFYEEGLKIALKEFANQPIHIQIFTDSINPKDEVEYFYSMGKKFHTDLTITTNANAENVDDKAASDMIAMSRYECLIRPDSGLSKQSSLIGKPSLEIMPSSCKVKGKTITLEGFNIIYRKKENSEVIEESHKNINTPISYTSPFPLDESLPMTVNLTTFKLNQTPVYAITYADGDSSYFYNQANFIQSIKKYARNEVDYILEGNKTCLAKDFLKDYGHILQEPKGMRSEIWKPYLILRTMHQELANSTIIYIDGRKFALSGSIEKLITIIQKTDRVFFEAGNLNQSHVKRDCFISMKCDEEYYYKAKQLDTSIIGFKNNQENRDFVKEWLEHCQNEKLVADMKSEKEELDGFVEHMHDQAIFSLLYLKKAPGGKFNASVLSIKEDFVKH